MRQICLDSHTDEIENITEQLRIKREICSELENQIIEKEVVIDELSKAEFCKRALTMDETNSCCSYLYSTSSTIPIITRYRQSGKEFLKLNAGLYVGKVTGFSYIIVNVNIRIKESKKYVPTMTELKKESCKHLCLVTTERMQKLKDHILSAVRDYDELSSGLIIPLSEPCLIGGQAEINKTGYGWEYRGSHCYEGTNYGEMTGLYVIGIQIQ